MLIENEFFNLFIEDKNVIMYTKKTGFLLKSFDRITSEHPRLKLNSFPALRKALMEAGDKHVIGTWIPLIDMTVSSDKMKVELVVNTTKNIFLEQKKEIIDEVRTTLKELGIVFGMKELTDDLFIPGRPITVAMGTEPVRGADAIVTYIEPPERKPVIREDGSADYYEMNFVFPVLEGDWLGEKIPPQEGIDGTDVFGNPIPSTRGGDIKLEYDRKTVTEESEEGKIVLRALHGGALEFINGIVSVGKHLVIKTDVGPQTGSITFDGTVAVYGTVLDGFSVVATGDVSIEGNEGVTNAKVIQSSNGDVYIKGGVFGGGSTIIEAKGSIYLKHANNCKLYAKEVHAGLYLLGTDVIAERVYVDKHRGRIIGGEIEALYSIECATAGNNHERTTTLYAKGVDKEALYIDMKEMVLDLKNRKEVVARLEEHTAKFELVATGHASHQAKALQQSKETIDSNNQVIAELDREIQLMLHQIKTAVPPQIIVTREAFPGTIIQIGKLSSLLHKQTKGTFKVIDGALNV